MRQPYPTPERTPAHRAPRAWPPLPAEPVVIPLIKPENAPQLTSLLVTAASLLGIGLAAVFLNGSGGAGGGLGLGLLLVSGATAVVSSAVALGQYLASRARNGRLLALYRDELDRLLGDAAGDAAGKEGVAQAALRTEAEWRRANDLPLVAPDAPHFPGYSLPPNTAPALIEQIQRRPGALWQRRPDDPDFLTVRIGAGQTSPRVRVELSEKAPAVRLPERNAGFAQQQRRASDFVAGARALAGVPVVIPLREYGSVAVVADPAHQELANEVVRALLGQIALLHSPYDAQITVITPKFREAEWNWVNALSAGVERDIPAVIGYAAPPPGAAIEQSHPGAAQIERLHAALTRREQRLIEQSGRQRQESPREARQIIVVDTLLPEGGQLTDHLLALAPVALALRRGAEIGVTVISTHLAADQAPAQCSLLLDTQAREARILGPAEPGVVPCALLDRMTAGDSQHVARILSRYEPQRDGERELPANVDLLTLFDPTRLDPATYNIEAKWTRGRARLDTSTSAPFTIPIGRTTAPEPLTIDFLNDGPHGLLIGKTGSGKSVLLQSLITALAISYPPDQLNFVLVDYKGGLGLDAYANLPHTLAFLTNLQSPGLTERFLTMLESELRARQELRKAKKPMPRLFVIIDEFAEMVARRGPGDVSADLIMDKVLSILRLGRGLDVHLLFASQRPESAFAKLQGYVQYRIAMRTNSEEDSREIIGRTDAATLPSRLPGRGYLLRGDYQLQLFQAARADIPLPDTSQREALDPDEPATTGELIARRMKAQTPPTAGRWPAALPAPSFETPSPLVLYLHGRLRRVAGAWGTTTSVPQRPPEMVAPIGWYDRPDQRAQGWYTVDLLGHQGALRGGPLLVRGDPNAGKSTTLQTLLLYFATAYSPDELRWFALDPTGAFSEFAALRHARDLRDPEQTTIIDGGDEAEFQAWCARLEAAMALDPARRPRLLVVADDFDDISQRFSSQARTRLHALAQAAARGRKQGVYLALSAAKDGFDTVPSPLVSAMSTKIVLHMANREAMAGLVGLRPAAMPEAAPGRGYAQTRATLDLIQVAAPLYGASEAERIEGIRALLAQSPWKVG